MSYEERLAKDLREYDRLIAHEEAVSRTTAPLAHWHAEAAKRLRARKAAFIVFERDMEVT